MQIEASSKNGYEVLRIREDLSLHSNLSDLAAAIDTCIQRNALNVALIFTPASRLYTRTIKTIVDSYKRLLKSGGRLAIIGPSQEIYDVLATFGLTALISVIPSENDLR
jgi:anti-anti-sigma regulatory factor